MKKFLFIVLLGCIALCLNHCGHQAHMRETLQKEHPDCYVTEDLEIICESFFEEHGH